MAEKRGFRLRTNAIFKPFVLMAAKFLGPGRLRLEMVKLAHDLDGAGENSTALPFGHRIGIDSESIQSGQRAA